MNLVVYSTCRIHFLPTARGRSLREYSDRCLIELREDGNGQYFLRGVYVENNTTKVSSSFDDPDEIRCRDGTYRLWLNLQTYDAFHKELHRSLDELILLKKTPLDIDLETIYQNELPKLRTNISNQENILINIYNRIRVKIDSIDFSTNELQILDVYKSTTIRELRAVFEHTFAFPSSTQYFFINGYLLDENASMNDLNIHPDSMFVLFLIQK